MPRGSTSDSVRTYLREIERNLRRGDATEHTHRPALKALIESLEPSSQRLVATNEPRRVACGAPDFNVTRRDVPVGNIETKDIGANLDETERSEQLKRYFGALNNLVLTDYLEFRWYVYGELRATARLGRRSPTGRLLVEDGGQADLESLLDGFLSEAVPTIARPKELAERMARMAHLLRDLIQETFRQEAEGQGPLHAQLGAFREELLPELKPVEFADMYAQTIAYGLFAACANTPPGERFTRQGAAFDLPKTNPFLRRLFGDIAGPGLDDRIAWAADNLAELLDRADMRAILQHFARKQGRADPVIDFYETFLHAYDPKMRELRGVYYTPEPVVSYIVRSVDHLLKTRFDCADGLAETSTVSHPVTTHEGVEEREFPRVLILDPACGTGTFLYFVMEQIRQNLGGQRGAWSAYVREHLLPRLLGFELLIAPYAVAHMKLGIELKDSGYDFATDDRLGVYLTNTLEQAIEKSERGGGFAEYLSKEGNEASEVKRDKPIMVVVGNPPYSGHSANKGRWVASLIEDYRKVNGRPLGERNPKWLQDDYVKFIRFGQWRIEQTGSGILALITNHAYLDNPTFRGMRSQLIQTFDEVYVLDLHGNKRKHEVAPDGVEDKNVFDIQQGVAVGVFVKRADSTSDSRGGARVFHAELWGGREGKYRVLASTDLGSTKWRELRPEHPQYLFVPLSTDLAAEYAQAYPVIGIFEEYASTVTTARNHFAMAYDAQSLVRRVRDLQDEDVDDAAVRARYGLKDVSYWTLAQARKEVAQLASIGDYVQPYCYRPFDFRWVFYHGSVCERLRYEVMQHMRSANVSLLTHRPQSPGEFTFAYCTNLIGDQCVAANKTVGGGNSFQFPLYVYPTRDSEEQGTLGDTSSWPAGQAGRRPNLNPQFVRELKQRLNLQFVTDGKGDLQKTFGPEDAFNFIYAALHSPTYRQRYAEFLKRDFPRIPLTSDPALFAALCANGDELTQLHLMESPLLGQRITTYPAEGDNRVEAVRYAEPRSGADGSPTPGRVYINKAQYFEGISPELWAFQVGGYQVMDKWLKDRKGRTLTWQDIEHYQKIVVALTETARLMADIDSAIAAHGGWPGAFSAGDAPTE